MSGSFDSTFQRLNLVLAELRPQRYGVEPASSQRSEEEYFRCASSESRRIYLRQEAPI